MAHRCIGKPDGEERAAEHRTEVSCYLGAAPGVPAPWEAACGGPRGLAVTAAAAATRVWRWW